MEKNGVVVLDTFAEAFPTWISRVVITGDSPGWALKAAVSATGFATSRIGCSCEAGIERTLGPEETPDGRPGVAILICAEKKAMKANVAARVSQCILPAPTASAFDGLPDAESRFFLRMHFFGDQYEQKCRVGERNCWKIPVMEGEYVGEERFGTVKGIAGGNFLVMGNDKKSTLAAAEAGAAAIEGMPDVIMSFAGGIVGSGSKVGCRNNRFPMPASTNDALCPTLKGLVKDSQVPEGVTTIYEIVINGLGEEPVKNAMRAGIDAAIMRGNITHIGASNFGGRLGPYQFGLHELFR